MAEREAQSGSVEGDMPEEKVSQQFKKGNGWSYSIMPSQHIIVPCRGEADCPMFGEPTDPELHYHEAIPVTPAADAGPRQPPICKHCSRDIELRNGEWRHVNYNGAYCFRPAEPYAPPVPQEAADTKWNDEIPRDNRFHDPLSPTTEPDWAMRVAREIHIPSCQECQSKFRSGPTAACVKEIHRVAALIREAGSERERELREALKRYGQHDEGEGCDIGTPAKTCTCGLDAAIKKAECS